MARRKSKTTKGLSRRFKITATGKVISRRTGKRHLLGGKRAKLKRHRRRPKTLASNEARAIRAILAI